MTTDHTMELDAWVDERRAALVAQALAEGIEVMDDPQAHAFWGRTLLASDFACAVARRQPQLLSASAWNMLTGGAGGAAERVVEAIAGAREEAAFMRALRQVRQREALRLVFRAVNALDDVPATLQQTTNLYVALVRAALDWASAAQRQRHGEARNAQGEAQQLVVIGMGKLGAGELNFSSDIDLILAYPEGGRSDGARALDNEDYFVRLARQLVHLLAQPGPHGIVARVDLRLRPFGQAGRLVLPFAAMEQYYQREGRDWERYAWIKAAPVAGDLAAGAQLLEMLRPFVYRKYLDYGAFAGMRKLKGLIAARVAREDLADNLKHGPGGIREAEFCVQLLQMIRGGREPGLRVRGVLNALPECVRLGLLERGTAARLRAAYLFLRAAENAVQMLADQQTHDIPAASAERLRVARALGFADWSTLNAELDGHRAFVEATFRDLLLPHAGEHGAPAASADVGLWRAARTDSLRVEAMEKAGFVPGDKGRRVLLAVARSAPVRMMSARSGERLDRLMPHLIGAARATAAPVPCLERLAALVQAVARRSSYLALLEEQPAARAHLAKLFADSALLADAVVAQPLLLDDVLDPRIEQLPLKRSAITEAIVHALDSLDERSPELDLERLNEVRASLAFRLGLAFRGHKASAPATARRLAALAAAVVAQVLTLARSELVARHGCLPGSEVGDGFAVIGYGSLGAGELGFASDLDLVFVYDQRRAGLESDGARPLEGIRWYQRLAQRVVHWLTSLQRGGRLYEVDTRLRPDGSKGMLVTSLESYADYQQRRAWIWEHQALVRARAIAGDANLMQRFGSWREVLLARPRDALQVGLEASRMRARWRRERDRSDARRVDLKQGVGGLLDLEFLLQILVLGHADRHPGLLSSGNTALLVEAARRAGLLDGRERQTLLDAHAALVDAALRCTLDKRPRVVARDEALEAHLTAVTRIAAAHGLDPDPPADPLPAGIIRRDS